MLTKKQIQLIEDALLALLNQKIESGELDNDEQELAEEQINETLLAVKAMQE